MNPNEMTLDQCRDWLAEDDGWRTETRSVAHVDVCNHQNSFRADVQFWFRRKDDPGTRLHPFPPTIDAIAAAMPEGWKIEVESHVGKLGWIASGWLIGMEDMMWESLHADTELLARARLAVACRMAERGSK